MSRFVPIPALALASGLLPCCALVVVTAVLELFAVGPPGCCAVLVAFAIELELSLGRIRADGWRGDGGLRLGLNGLGAGVGDACYIH